MAGALNVKSGLDVIVEEMNKNEFMDVIIKRKMPDGSFVDATPASMSVLSTQAKVATQAQALLGATKKERTKWAIEMKNYANALYAEQRYSDAMEKYVEALTAADFGGRTDDAKPNDDTLASDTDTSQDVDVVQDTTIDANNIDILVIPVLTNLAACSIQLQQWKKADKFCQQAIELRPNCAKAFMRKGIALFNLGGYCDAKQALLTARNLSNSSDGDRVLAINEHDDQRITILLNKIQAQLNVEKAYLKKQKAKLKEVFDKNAKKKLQVEPIRAATRSSDAGNGPVHTPVRVHTFYEWITELIVQILSFIASKLSLGNKKDS